jgi:hypothetical protein
MSDNPYSTLKCKIDDIVLRASTLQKSVIEQERTVNTTDKLEAIARVVLPDQGGNIGRVKHAVKGGIKINRLLVEVELNGLFSEVLETLNETPTGRRRCELKVSQKKAFLKDLASVTKTRDMTNRLNRLLALARNITTELIILEVQWKSRTVLIDGGKQVSGRLQLESLLSTEIDGYLKVCDGFCSEETLAILEATPNTLPITLLTCPPDNQPRFVEFLSKMRNEKYRIDVIIVDNKKQFLHDRFIICCSRGWQIGGSLKDAGKKPMTITLLDAKKEIENMIDEFITGKRAEIRML